MEPQVTHRSDLTSNRTEYPGLVAKISEYLRPLRGEDFLRGHPPIRARLTTVFVSQGAQGLPML